MPQHLLLPADKTLPAQRPGVWGSPAGSRGAPWEGKGVRRGCGMLRTGRKRRKHTSLRAKSRGGTATAPGRLGTQLGPHPGCCLLTAPHPRGEHSPGGLKAPEKSAPSPSGSTGNGDGASPGAGWGRALRTHAATGTPRQLPALDCAHSWEKPGWDPSCWLIRPNKHLRGKEKII